VHVCGKNGDGVKRSVAASTVNIDEKFDVYRAEPVGGVAHEHTGVVDIDVAYAQHAGVDSVSLPAKVYSLSVLGPLDEGRRRRRLDRAD